MKRTFTIALALCALAACDADEDEVRAVSSAGASALEAQRISNEVDEATDFDAIAEETVDDFDTSDFDALTDG